MSEMRTIIKGLVSIVTPVYNGETYITGYMESILGQTYQSLELILVDDGSTDKTVLAAESYRDRLEKRGIQFYLVQAPHRNASSALCHGLPLVSGEYLCWPDSDDILRSDSIEERVRFLKEHPQYHCVRSLPWYFDHETGERTSADEKKGDLKKETLFWDILESRTFVSCGCYMLLSEDFFSIYPEGKIPIYNVGQNFQMLLPFMYVHNCPTIKKELYGVAVRENSHSRRRLTRKETEQKYREYEELVDEIAEICQITDSPSLQRIDRWKIHRRFQLAIQYQDFHGAMQAWKEMFGLKDKQLVCYGRRFLLARIKEVKLVKTLRFLYRIRIQSTSRSPLKYLWNLAREKEWELYKLKKRKRICGTPTIIASNCVGTIIYHDMRMPWNSPTVNLMIPMNDFVKFVENIRWYIKQPLHFLDDSEHSYPVGILGDIKIFFVHYQSKDEALEKWEIRKKRINWEQLFIIGCEKDGCTYETLQKFEKLPYKNKVILTRKKYPEFASSVQIRGFEDEQELGTLTNFKPQIVKRRYLDDFDYISFLQKNY